MAGVEEHDHAGDVGRSGGRGRDKVRRDDYEGAGGRQGADTQAGWDVHRVKVARGRLG